MFVIRFESIFLNNNEHLITFIGAKIECLIILFVIKKQSMFNV